MTLVLFCRILNRWRTFSCWLCSRYLTLVSSISFARKIRTIDARRRDTTLQFDPWWQLLGVLDLICTVTYHPAFQMFPNFECFQIPNVSKFQILPYSKCFQIPSVKSSKISKFKDLQEARDSTLRLFYNELWCSGSEAHWGWHNSTVSFERTQTFEFGLHHVRS